MQPERTPAASRPPLRGRVAAYLRAERGDTLIEVLVAGILVALIAVATFTGYGAVVHVAGDQSRRAQASALAQQDQARLRGLTLDALGSSLGNQKTKQQIDNTTYTIVSASQFVSGSGASSCTSSGTSTADEVQTTSTVTWPGDHTPVIVHGLVAPQAGGSLVARVTDQSGNPVSGATIALSGGPTSATALSTDAAGCAVFGGLSGGSYTVTATKAGWVTFDQTSSATTPNLTVVPTQTASTSLTLAQAGGITATFTTNYNGSTHPSSADQVVAWNPGNNGLYNVFGTAGTLGNGAYQSTVDSGDVYFPTGNALFYPSGYTVYAGSCSGDYSSGGYRVANVSAASLTPVVLPLPALLVMVWTGNSSSSKGSLISTAPTVTLTDNNASCVNTNYPQTQVPSATQGALVDPGQVYGNFRVCASASISGRVYRNTATVANTAYTGGTTVNIYLGSRASGRANGACT